MVPFVSKMLGHESWLKLNRAQRVRLKQMDRQASFDPEVKLLLPRISVDLLEADEVVIEDVDRTDKHAAIDKH